MKSIRLFAISGSTRPNSSNHSILKYMASLSNEIIQFEIYNDLQQLPLFEPGTEPAPEAVIGFREKIEEADAVIICTPEYAFGIPGVLKNALDWTVSSGEFSDKITALITASSSGEKAHQAMSWVLEALGAAPAEDCRLLISFIRTKVNPEGRITDDSVRVSVDSVLKAVIAQVHKKTGAD